MLERWTALTITIRQHDETLLTVHDSYLHLKLQTDLSKILSTPLAFRNEVDVGISKEEAQDLARPRILTPIQQELMDWYHRLYQLSLPKMFRLSELGHLPKRLLDCKKNSPLCVACQFDTDHRHPWRTKGKVSGSIHTAYHVEPGDGVLMDQIVSAQPGLIPQMSGFLTRRRIWGCTTFCDNVSDFVYVHLMRDFTVEETLLAVKYFEKTLAQAYRPVKHYHADNEIFANNDFIESINKKDQKITFCAVGAHHQNGIIENKKKMLTLSGQTLLLYAIRHWPEMIDSIFWPFAMKAAAERHNSLSVNDKNQTPSSVLYNVEIEEIPEKTFHNSPPLCVCLIAERKAQEALARQSGSHDAVLVST